MKVKDGKRCIVVTILISDKVDLEKRNYWRERDISDKIRITGKQLKIFFLILEIKQKEHKSKHTYQVMP